MDKRDLEQLLSDVAGGSVTPADALTRIQTAPTADLGFAQLDLSRGVRQGAGEVVYGAGKTADQIAAIIKALRDAGQERILVTRLDAEKAARTAELLGNGIDLGYVPDAQLALVGGKPSPTGNGRRESFRYAPIPRMRATYMESGKADKESIIASVKKGIYVDQFSNGEVQIGEGDFTFFVKSGFLIENGRLTQPVKDINIIGNGPQALADIVAVGNDLKIDEGAWTCGKGQSCPVSCGIPTVLINKLTVGGE